MKDINNLRLKTHFLTGSAVGYFFIYLGEKPKQHQMIRKVLFWTVAVILVGILIYSFLELRKGNIQKVEVVQAVPTDAALFINTHDLTGFIREEMSRNKIWQELGSLKQIGNFQETLDGLDSLLLDDREMAGLYRDADISFSLPPLMAQNL